VHNKAQLVMCAIRARMVKIQSTSEEGHGCVQAAASSARLATCKSGRALAALTAPTPLLADVRLTKP